MVRRPAQIAREVGLNIRDFHLDDPAKGAQLRDWHFQMLYNPIVNVFNRPSSLKLNHTWQATTLLR